MVGAADHPSPRSTALPCHLLFYSHAPHGWRRGCTKRCCTGELPDTRRASFSLHPVRQPSPRRPIDWGAPHLEALLQAALFAAVTVPRRAECLAAIRADLEAGADVNARRHGSHTPLHWAARYNTDAEAVTAALEALLAAGADVRVKSIFGAGPLQWAAWNDCNEAAAAAVRVLLAAGADALDEESGGRTLLLTTLDLNKSQAAEALLAAMPADAALVNMCTSESPLAHQLLPRFIANHLPLAEAQWALIPITSHIRLACALPAALASSAAQARQLVRRLPPADVQRLRTFALCLARMQRTMPVSQRRRYPLWPEYLPPAAVERILTFFDLS